MGRTESMQALEAEIGALLRRLRHVMAERAQAVHPALHAGSYWILSSIARCGPLRASAIAEQYQLDKGAVSRQVQHLMQLGLAERKPDPADGRAQLLQVTAEGRRRIDAVNKDGWNNFTQRLADWEVEEIDAMVRAFARFNTVVGETAPEQEADR